MAAYFAKAMTLVLVALQFTKYCTSMSSVTYAEYPSISICSQNNEPLTSEIPTGSTSCDCKDRLTLFSLNAAKVMTKKLSSKVCGSGKEQGNSTELDSSRVEEKLVNIAVCTMRSQLPPYMTDNGAPSFTYIKNCATKNHFWTYDEKADKCDLTKNFGRFPSASKKTGLYSENSVKRNSEITKKHKIRQSQ